MSIEIDPSDNAVNWSNSTLTAENSATLTFTPPTLTHECPECGLLYAAEDRWMEAFQATLKGKCPQCFLDILTDMYRVPRLRRVEDGGD